MPHARPLAQVGRESCATIRTLGASAGLQDPTWETVDAPMGDGPVRSIRTHGLVGSRSSCRRCRDSLKQLLASLHRDAKAKSWRFARIVGSIPQSGVRR